MNEEQTPLESLDTLETVESALEPSPVEPPELDPALPEDTMEAPSDLPEAGDASPDSEQIIASLQGELANHRQELAQQSELLETYKTRYISLAAEFDNFRKRTQRERQEQEQQIKAKTINELLAVVDNFERARTQIKPGTDEGMEIHKSYQGVYKSFVDSLKRLGVSPMRPEGQPFDPNYHEALLQEPTSEHPEGTVMEELVRGYLLEDRVLRHAKVKVAAPSMDGVVSEEAPAAPADEGSN
jgi:molecular chaperone GrpE